MEYMTLKEAAEKWGVTPRRVNYYCAGGRIPGAVKMAGRACAASGTFVKPPQTPRTMIDKAFLSTDPKDCSEIGRASCRERV